MEYLISGSEKLYLRYLKRGGAVLKSKWVVHKFVNKKLCFISKPQAKQCIWVWPWGPLCIAISKCLLHRTVLCNKGLLHRTLSYLVWCCDSRGVIKLLCTVVLCNNPLLHRTLFLLIAQNPFPENIARWRKWVPEMHWFFYWLYLD